jgi:hypothetical protein
MILNVVNPSKSAGNTHKHKQGTADPYICLRILLPVPSALTCTSNAPIWSVQYLGSELSL